MKALRGGLIGCGFFATNHLHAWADCEAAGIDAICDSDPLRLKLIGDQFKISKRYTDATVMIATENLDFLDIATTAPSHRALVEMSAKAKLPVICQKPFATTLADAKAMVQTCAVANVPLMVHENFRWQSPIQAVKRIVDSGEIGEAFWGRVSFRSAYDVYSRQPYLAEGERFIVEDLGIHALDVARFLFGEVENISARIKRVNPAIKGEDVATVLLDHGKGTSSIVDCSYASLLEQELFPQTLIEIDGTLGSLRLAANYALTVTTRKGTRLIDVAPALLPWATKPWHNIQESVSLIQQHWVQCLTDGHEPQTSGRDNLNTLTLVEAVYLSAKTKQTIAISDFSA